MFKEIISVIEGILATILIWQVFIPFFFDLAKTEIGSWAYLGLVWAVLSFAIIEYKSYKENELTWLASHLFGNLLN